MASILDDRTLTFKKSAESGRLFRMERRYDPNKALVFVSHRQADAHAARAVAQVLVEVADVDVYLDAFNTALAASGDPAAVTDVIDFGLNVCTHLLAVVSDNTRGSWWVPYQVGVARNRPVPCGFTLLETVQDLPEYLRTADIVQDADELVRWAKGNLPNQRVNKSLSPTGVSVPGLPTFRRERVRFNG